MKKLHLQHNWPTRTLQYCKFNNFWVVNQLHSCTSATCQAHVEFTGYNALTQFVIQLTTPVVSSLPNIV